MTTDPAKAEEKAKAHVAAVAERHPEGNHVFAGVWAGDLFERRGKLSVRDTMALDTIEAGVFPFGKHSGTKIADAADSYILYFADQADQKDKSEVSIALCKACLGVALEKGLIAKRQAARDARQQAEAKSDFVGEIGKRQVFTGVLFYSHTISSVYDVPLYLNKIRIGDDIVVYIGGKSLGDVGSDITIKATVKSHDIYNGCKTTRVSRPA